MNMKG